MANSIANNTVGWSLEQVKKLYIWLQDNIGEG